MRRIHISSIAVATTMLSVGMMTSGMVIASLSSQDQRPSQSRVDRAPGPRDTNPFRSLMKHRRPDQRQSLQTDRAPRPGPRRAAPNSDRVNRPNDRAPKQRMERAPGNPGRNANRPGLRGPQQGRGMRDQQQQRMQQQMQQMMQRMMTERFGQGGPGNGGLQQGRNMQGSQQGRGMRGPQQRGQGMRSQQQQGPGMRGMMQSRPNSRRPQSMRRYNLQPWQDCNQCPMNRSQFREQPNRQGPPQQRMNRPQNNRRRPAPPNNRPARRQPLRRPVI